MLYAICSLLCCGYCYTLDIITYYIRSFITPRPLFMWLLCCGHYYCGSFSCGYYGMDGFQVSCTGWDGDHEQMCFAERKVVSNYKLCRSLSLNISHGFYFLFFIQHLVSFHIFSIHQGRLRLHGTYSSRFRWPAHASSSESSAYHILQLEIQYCIWFK